MDNTSDIDIREQITTESVFGKMAEVGAIIAEMPDAKFGDDTGDLVHSYGDGLYIRQITMKKGTFLLSKIHKTTHPYFVMAGDASVFTAEGMVRIIAPYAGITKAGTQRLLYMHEETVWVTVHKTDKTDLSEIEEEIIAKDFKAFSEHQTRTGMLWKNRDRFRDVTRKVIEDEKPGFWSDWTEEQQGYYTNSDWETFSRSRGYSEEAIANFKEWLELTDEANKNGHDPCEIIRDLTVPAFLVNLGADTKGEFLLSSHLPKRKKEVAI